MARRGEVADIASKAQYDYFMKQLMAHQPGRRQAKDKRGRPARKVNPLDARGQAHRALRDENGNVTQPGGGESDSIPTGSEAYKALMKFQKSGLTRNDLPKVSPTKNAARKDLEHAKMKRDQVVRPAVRPPGSSEFDKLQRQRQRLNDSREYLSKSIDEMFYRALDEALGI